MNLFVVGCNLCPDFTSHSQVLAIFKSTASRFPNLDPSSLWDYRNDSVFIASMGHSAAASAPRTYVQATATGAVLFDGSLFDSVSGKLVDQADWLHNNWDVSPGRLEGQFVAVKVDFQPAAVEVFNDHLGIYRIYLCHSDKGYFISNNLGLLTRLRNNFALDPIAIAMQMAHGRVMGQRTLQRDIRSIAPGSFWRWTQGGATTKYASYFNRSLWSRQIKQVKSPGQVSSLAKRMVLPLESMSRRYGPINAPLTAGRDSRVLFAMLQKRQVPSHFFSVGDPQMVDARIGAQLANHYQACHSLRTIDEKRIIEDWDLLMEQLVLQTDGTVSIAHVASIIDRPINDHLEVMLYGACGEYARKQSINSKYFLNRRTTAGLLRHFIDAFEKSGKVLSRRAAKHSSRTVVEKQIRRLVQEGFDRDDILLAHYMFYRSNQFAGSNVRMLQPYYDVYCPYCTPPFAKAAFTEPLINRLSDRLHYQLIENLLPDLHQLPMQYPWHLSHPLKMVAKMLRKDIKDNLTGRKRLKRVPAKKLQPGYQTIRYRRATWLKALVGRYRPFCLDQQNSLIWDVIDRNAFDRVTRVDNDPIQLWHHQDEIFDAITLFVYANGNTAWDGGDLVEKKDKNAYP